MNNSNLNYSYCETQEIGTIRETFFVNAFDTVFYSDVGDFKVGETIFEVGGKGKDFGQIKDLPESYLAIDIDFSTHEKKVPLWLFGFMY